MIFFLCIEQQSRMMARSNSVCIEFQMMQLACIAHVAVHVPMLDFNWFKMHGESWHLRCFACLDSHISFDVDQVNLML